MSGSGATIGGAVTVICFGFGFADPLPSANLAGFRVLIPLRQFEMHP